MSGERPAQDHQPAPPDADADPNPRAFATATGLVFQVVGLVLSLGGCCLWSTSGWYQDQAAHAVESLGDYLKDGPKAIAMLATVASFTGGLGLLATGVGLQGEHPRSGVAAMVVSAGLAAAWWGCLIALLAAGGSLWQVLLAGVMSAASTILFLLAGNSARVLRLHPPPADRSVFKEEQERHGNEALAGDSTHDDL